MAKSKKRKNSDYKTSTIAIEAAKDPKDKSRWDKAQAKASEEKEPA